MRNTSFTIASLTLALVLAGCTTGKMTSSEDGRDNAIVITGAHGQSTYIFDRAASKPVATRAPNATVCPTCDADVATYYTTAKLTPKCTTCGAQRKIISHGQIQNH